MNNSAFSRRDFHKLVAAAFGGLTAGSVIGCGEAEQEPSPAPTPGKTPAEVPGPADGEKGSGTQTKTDDTKLPPDVDPQLLTQEPHVCRGLNTCMNKGKSGENACAGQGSCATAEAHTCAGQNACKGQGGCGDYPGQNTCQTKGSCAVPLGQEDVWQKARGKFEELMQAGGKQVGQAPKS